MRQIAAVASSLAFGGFVAGSSLAADTYSVSGTTILKNNAAWCGGGVNAFDQFGWKSKAGWNVKVVREIVDDFSECPISTSEGGRSTPIGYTHPLETIVNNNRSEGAVTILAIFGWDAGSYSQILGNRPSSMSWYAAYKSRLAALAQKFAGQSDVWIDPWNEPYAWDNAGFAESQWVADMNDIYNTIRNAGNNNIVLIPGQAMDTQETVLLNQASFLNGKQNVVATIHCYNAWTGNSQADCERRIHALHAKGWALLFGEVGEDDWVQDCTRLLNASVTQRVPSLGWSWDAGDGSKVIENGSPTAWGNQFLPYLPRYAPGLAAGAVYELEPACAPGKAADVSGVSTSDGAAVHLWTYFGQNNQKWKAYDVGSGNWEFEPMHAAGKRLDVSNAGSADGTQVQIWTANSSSAQRWKAYDAGGGYWTLEPQCAAGKRLDVNAAASADGTKIQIWTGNGSSAQRWKLIER